MNLSTIRLTSAEIFLLAEMSGYQSPVPNFGEVDQEALRNEAWRSLIARGLISRHADQSVVDDALRDGLEHVFNAETVITVATSSPGEPADFLHLFMRGAEPLAMSPVVPGVFRLSRTDRNAIDRTLESILDAGRSITFMDATSGEVDPALRVVVNSTDRSIEGLESLSDFSDAKQRQSLLDLLLGPPARR